MKNLITLMMIVILGLSGVTFAQNQPEKSKKPDATFQEFLKKADKDNDGKVSKEEFLAIKEDKVTAEEKFKKMDTNGDGYITEDEYNSAHKNK